MLAENKEKKMINQTGISPYSNYSQNSSPAFGMAVRVEVIEKTPKALRVFQEIFQKKGDVEVKELPPGSFLDKFRDLWASLFGQRSTRVIIGETEVKDYKNPDALLRASERILEEDKVTSALI